MAERKVIAVIGATGAQGGGLVRAILADPERRFAPRAITRKPASDRARELAAAGAEVVEGDADRPDTLGRAFAGAHGAFCLTNYWEHFSPERELAQATAMADAAGAAGVAHVVWSTLEDTRKWVPLDDERMPTLMGKYKVPHFDAKGEADARFAAKAPTTPLLTTFYWDNLIFFGMQPKRDASGTLVLALPMGDKPLSGIAAEDIGKCAFGIFRRGAEFIGRTVGIAGENLTGVQMAEEMSRAFGEPVRYQAVPLDVYRGLGFPGADDLGNMFQVFQEFGDEFRAARPIALARELDPELQTFREWLGRNKERIPRG
jgi:uncharacterized protein YbjT (DUF2867 family)